ncbi:hypothetical protein Bca4012_051396 [Brassica carinata]|uniref:(rape) hypothetical protein n=1 Tax=Brassica napus TaxID=3708 RepID=A0A078G453_BRANA|nr:unnamed protein product [Brassica napus]CDY21255.1 BnaC02g28680D [Brassica napus]
MAGASSLQQATNPLDPRADNLCLDPLFTHLSFHRFHTLLKPFQSLMFHHQSFPLLLGFLVKRIFSDSFSPMETNSQNLLINISDCKFYTADCNTPIASAPEKITFNQDLQAANPFSLANPFTFLEPHNLRHLFSTSAFPFNSKEPGGY